MDDVLTELRLATESLDRLYGTQRRHNAAIESEIAELWQSIAEGRDELLAVANRLESLTRSSTSAGLREVRDADS